VEKKMNFIQEHYTDTLEIKQSKFIAHLIPYAIYDETLQELKNQHPKARHFVVAYRYLNDFDQIVEHSSDDGEPKGTSGKPTLMVLQGKDLINTAIIVVRYFGGTKLGTGGLVRAYSDATNLVIKKATLLEYKKEITKTISFDYTNLRKIEYECLACGINIIEKSFSDKTTFVIKSDIESMERLFCKVDLD
jgi:uncharacterized YigZ family protein